MRIYAFSMLRKKRYFYMFYLFPTGYLIYKEKYNTFFRVLLAKHSVEVYSCLFSETRQMFSSLKNRTRD